MSALDQVDTVVLVMMENRSFDHVLGNLSLEGINRDVEGLRRPLKNYRNLYNGSPFKVFRMKDGTLPADPPHEYHDIATQLMPSDLDGRLTMGGFVESFAASLGGSHPGSRPTPMGYLPSKEVPITTFLARNYCVCDNWFSSLPSSTQPNRTMAFTGESSIYKTKLQLISTRDMIFDWLERADVSWRVYHDGFSFFALYPDAWDYMLAGDERFRDYEFLYADLKSERDGPQVVIVEPTYHDAPHFGSDHANDNHAPLAMGWGEEFLRRTYDAVVANPVRWSRTVMILYYDEHGGFWDHVPPPMVSYTTLGNDPYAFSSLGPRIPAIVISPLVEAGSVCHELFDHTSVLQLLAERFTPGQPYSASVQQRAQQGVRSVSAALTRTVPRTDGPPAPAEPILVESALGEAIVSPPHSDNQRALEFAAQELLNQRYAETVAKYPELVQWRDAVGNGRDT